MFGDVRRCEMRAKEIEKVGGEVLYTQGTLRKGNESAECLDDGLYLKSVCRKFLRRARTKRAFRYELTRD